MSLNRKETDKLIEKLRDKYNEYAYKYSPKFFDQVAFQKRYKKALDDKMNIEAFIFAEISNFEQIKAKYEEKQNHGEVTRKIDDMIEAQLKLIKKYPPIEIHERSGIEMWHFLGAINTLSKDYLPALWLILREANWRNYFANIEHELNQYALFDNLNLPKKAEDFVLYISRPSIREVDIEKARNNYLKESAFILHDISVFCDAIIESRNSILEEPLHFNKNTKSEKSKISEIFCGHTGYGTAIKIKDFTECIINDFRLNAFKRKSSDLLSF